MNKTKTVVLGIILALVEAVNVFLIIRLLRIISRFNIVPMKYYILLLALFALSVVIPIATVIITWGNKRHKVYKAITVISSILLVLSIAVCILGTHYYSYAAETFQKVTSVDSKRSTVGVYTSNSENNSAEAAETAPIQRYLVLKNMDSDTIEQAVNMVRADQGGAITVDAYDDIDSLMASLEEDGGAALLNTAYVDLFNEIDGGEEITGAITRVAEYEVVDTLQESDTESIEPKEAEDPFLLYISGIDVWGHITEVSRSDVNILMAVNPRTKQILLVNTPRDFYVPLANAGGASDKLTHAGIFGVDVSEETMEMLYGVDVDYYFKLNFSGFEGLIDALGGITVWSDYDFTVDPIKHYVVGNNDLTGLEALAFARERHSFEDGDRQRGINQMNVIQSVVDKLTSSALLKNYKEVMDQIEGTFATDMSMEEIANFVRFQLDHPGTWDIQKYSVNGTDDMQQTYTGGGMTLYVMQPDYSTVAYASEQIQKVLNGEVINLNGAGEEAPADSAEEMTEQTTESAEAA